MSIDWGSELDKVAEATAPITVGVHTFKIVDSKVTTASTGNKMIVVTAKVESGPDAGKTLIHNIVFSFDKPQAMKMTMRRLSALGMSQEKLRAENPSLEQIAGQLIGRTAQGKITHRDWQGDTQNEVEWLSGDSAAAGGVPAAPIPVVAGVPAATTIPTPEAAPAAPVAATPEPVTVPAAAGDEDEANF